MDTTYLVFDHKEGSYSAAVSSVVTARQLRDQPFRIYRIIPELDKITVYARHLFYDLLDNMIKSYKGYFRCISRFNLSSSLFFFYSSRLLSLSMFAMAWSAVGSAW
jgi:hypothetical protein